MNGITAIYSVIIHKDSNEKFRKETENVCSPSVGLTVRSDFADLVLRPHVSATQSLDPQDGGAGGDAELQDRQDNEHGVDALQKHLVRNKGATLTLIIFVQMQLNS